MNTFSLPDLGEGLQEADLVEWLVEEGAHVKEDQIILLVETAKAIVELPAPVSCIVTQFRAQPGDTVKVGQALFDYESAAVAIAHDSAVKQAKAASSEAASRAESVSVVGELGKASDSRVNLYEAVADKPASPPEPVCINAFKEAKSKPARSKTPESGAAVNAARDSSEKTRSYQSTSYHATPSTVAFAKKLGLEDLLHHTYYGELNLRDLLKIYEEKQLALAEKAQHSAVYAHTQRAEDQGGAQTLPLKGARKFMAQVMTAAHQQIPAVTLFDDVDISHWSPQEDITLRMIQAIVQACQKVGIMNTWYDSKSMSLEYHSAVHLGLAVNAKSGLYVPVIRDCQDKSGRQLRSQINHFRKQINEQTIASKDLLGATITLSNFGALTGRYATPIIVPPQVCIVGAGKARIEPVVHNDQLKIGQVLPLSISFDHRAATGGEAAAFMHELIQSLGSE